MKDGSSLRDHLSGLLVRVRDPVKRKSIQSDLSLPPFPEAVRYLWDAYLRLRRRKSVDMMGNALPLEWPDILAFNQLAGLRLKPWEIEIIERLDNIYLIERAKARET
jgi:hypothetical protein